MAVTAGAHEDAEFHLAGLTFCVDTDSVQVDLELPDAPRRATAQAALTRSLAEQLEAVFARTGVAAAFQASCAGSRAYTILTADVRYLDPESYVGFGNQPYNYTLFVQVGRHNGMAALEALGHLPDNQYNAWVSEIYAEGDAGRPFEQFVPEQAAPLIGGLTSYWWEDNPIRAGGSRLAPPLIGGVLALATAFVLLRLLRRRARPSVKTPE